MNDIHSLITAEKAQCGHRDCAGLECPKCGSSPCCWHLDTCDHYRTRVHNHPPYRPNCNERRVDGQLRGACLTDDGSDR